MSSDVSTRPQTHVVEDEVDVLVVVGLDHIEQPHNVLVRGELLCVRRESVNL